VHPATKKWGLAVTDKCLWQVINSASHRQLLPTDQAGGCSAVASLGRGHDIAVNAHFKNNSVCLMLVGM